MVISVRISDEEGNLVITNRYDKDLKPVEIP